MTRYMNVADYQMLADRRAGIMAECTADHPTFFMHLASRVWLFFAGDPCR